MRMHHLFTLLTAATAATGAMAQANQDLSRTVGAYKQEVRDFYTDATGLPSNDVTDIVIKDGVVIAVTAAGAVQFTGEGWSDTDAPAAESAPTAENAGEIHDWAKTSTGITAAAAENGLILIDGDGAEFVYPAAGNRSWAPRPVKAVTVDSDGALWFASPQGVGKFDGKEWTLFEGSDGLPYNDFTSAAAGPGGVWFGTTKGAIRWDGEDFRYRQGMRWLPSDEVRDIEVAADGSAWIATAGGVSHIQFLDMTLAEKAKHYEDLIDKYNRRTEFGYVLETTFERPGDLDSPNRNYDSDNDGLWTCMYAAGECYAFAATGDPKAKERADLAWSAMRQLGTVTQGGSHPAPKGFVARTILPTSGENPNETNYTPEKDRETQKRDKLWKVIDPRWPTSEDGQWYWKTDTSSDELDGHYYFYGLYYDLVADEEQKKVVREHVRDLTDHLIDNGYQLVDHDGLPVRWARYSPEEMNGSLEWWIERGLNSLSMLSYLQTTAHITGDAKYKEHMQILMDEHGYHQNMLYPKVHMGAGTGNQSDDEMAFMTYYNLMKYESDPELKRRWALSWSHYWRLEEPENNPFFNFAYIAMCKDVVTITPFAEVPMIPRSQEWLDESIETLVRFPLDRFAWAHDNSERLDIIELPPWSYLAGESRSGRAQGYRPDNNVIPVDERYFNHWNHSPWSLGNGGNGTEMGSGAVYLLPYYMGVYYGFIK